jgi:hypothetical protein
VSTHSIDLSATGLLCAGATGYDVGDLVKFEMLLDEADPVKGIARVLRTANGSSALDFKDVGPDERKRLSEHIIKVKRRELADEMRSQVFHQRELTDSSVDLSPINRSRPRGRGGLVTVGGYR